ncbi:MAG: hypothetical protein K8I04_14705 [Gammaproteobacteria bacterium]|nr:hypothetical protein [Gammaproteobacteria bacterium]
MELRDYILAAIDDILKDAATDEGRALVLRDAHQLVEHLEKKWAAEQQNQILVLLKGEANPSTFSSEIASEAAMLFGWFKAMSATARRPAIVRDHLAGMYAPPLLNPAFLLTLAGPLCGGIGWFSEYQWLFWVGVGLSGLTFFLNLASGVLKMPILPTLFTAVGAFSLSPWYVGAGAGLLLWTGFELIGETFGRAAKNAS